MAVLRAIVLLALGGAAGFAADRFLLEEATTPPVPAGQDAEPGPGDPPVVWLDGTIEELGRTSLRIREGQGPRLDLERFALGATAFFRADGDGWRELAPRQASFVADGQVACVESFLDGRRLLALRVFLGAECGPAGPT